MNIKERHQSIADKKTSKQWMDIAVWYMFGLTAFFAALVWALVWMGL